jgi:DNA repair photolyase
MVKVSSIERKMQRSLDMLEPTSDVIGEMLNRRMPIHFGGISDPFSNKAVAAKSIKLLQLLKKHNYPVVLSTKNTNLLVRDETIQILKGFKFLLVQISLSTHNSNLAKLIEPAAPSPQKRIEGLKILSNEGISTSVRLQPLLYPWINQIVKHLLPQLRESGCKHVTVEYLKLPVEKNISKIEKLFRILSWDGYDFYRKKGAILVGREWILPAKFKWAHLQTIVASIHQHKMTYGSGDYHLNHLGDTPCCCGLYNQQGFNNWFKGNFGYTIKQSPPGEIRFDKIIKYWFPSGNISTYINSNCRLVGGNTILDYLQHKWNKPGTANAPDTYLGVTWTGEKDSRGNCIYCKKEVI